MSIVSLETLKEHLRYDDDSNDLMLQGYLEAADSVVKNYITDEFTNAEYPKAIHQAILLLCGYWDQYRNAEQEMPVNGNFLPMPVQSLLYPYRKPTAI
ncbi:phage gp6-like head-tail connector protein [Acinetobacter radioresistens]|uniref:head-tail connector protein n=1 Tax=Acinetobacter radioresistens TaxID=40216 RepID=UPI0020031540|nr:head-tail connector protein [Acinetobacter radioresistens]MCK4097436.1 phage gp6-like head-tail connector protein [Acinetobacter radioresistens]MCU4310007.1 head-tail connector protein [Acinetobacter radioresistens]